MTTKRAAMAKFNEVSRLTRKGLTGLGLARELKGGHGIQEVLYKRRILEDTPWGWVGLLEVDTQRLPRKVDIPKLVDPATVHHVQGVIGHRVKCHNTTGVIYLVELDPKPKRRLPRKVSLDLGDPGESRTGIPAGGYQIPLGMGRQGPVWRSLAELDCILVGGTRRRGKSVWLNTALVALLRQHGPDGLKLAIIDPKAVEFAAWRNVGHLLGKIATDAAEAENLLWELAEELDRRKALFTALGVKKLTDYNDQAEPPLPAIVLVVDELADLVLGSGGTRGDVFKMLARLVSIGGALGLHAILATQTPRAEVIAGTLKANVTTRLSFWLPSVDEYRIVLNPAPGATFPKPGDIPGRFVAKLADGYHLLQGFYLGDDAVKAAIQRASKADADQGQVGHLDAETLDLLTWAWESNDGDLTVSDIRETWGISKRQAEKRAAELEKRGYLVKDPSRNNRRMLSLKAIESVETGGETGE